jgi:hypothetical protein
LLGEGLSLELPTTLVSRGKEISRSGSGGSCAVSIGSCSVSIVCSSSLFDRIGAVNPADIDVGGSDPLAWAPVSSTLTVRSSELTTAALAELSLEISSSPGLGRTPPSFVDLLAPSKRLHLKKEW